MSEVITGLHAVTIHIKDPEKARTFYRDVLGLKELLFDVKASRLVFALPGHLDPAHDAPPSSRRRG